MVLSRRCLLAFSSASISLAVFCTATRAAVFAARVALVVVAFVSFGGGGGRGFRFVGDGSVFFGFLPRFFDRLRRVCTGSGGGGGGFGLRSRNTIRSNTSTSPSSFRFGDFGLRG